MYEATSFNPNPKQLNPIESRFSLSQPQMTQMGTKASADDGGQGKDEAIIFHALHKKGAVAAFNCKSDRVLFWGWFNGLEGHLAFVSKKAFTDKGFWLYELSDFASKNPNGSKVPLSVIKRFLGLTEEMDLRECIPGLDSSVYRGMTDPKVCKAIQLEVAASSRRYVFQVQPSSSSSNTLVKFTLQRQITATMPHVIPAQLGWIPDNYKEEILKKGFADDVIVKKPYTTQKRDHSAVEKDVEYPMNRFAYVKKARSSIDPKKPLWKQVLSLFQATETISATIKQTQGELQKLNESKLHKPRVPLDQSGAERARADSLLTEVQRVRAVLVKMGLKGEISLLDEAVEGAESVRSMLKTLGLNKEM